MRAAVEANEPGRFLDAIEQVDSLGVAEAAADEIAPLRQHPDPRVRMYAVMARTVLGPRGPAEAKELIDLFDDPDEDITVRCAAGSCLELFGEEARDAVPSFIRAMNQENDPREASARQALLHLGHDITGSISGMGSIRAIALGSETTLRKKAEHMLRDARPDEWLQWKVNQMFSREMQ